MFVVEVGSVLTTFYWIYELATGTGNPLFTGQVALWLWFTVLFAIIPAMFLVTYPELAKFNILRLTNPESAILASVIFNALIIIALIPLALRGVSYKPMSASKTLSRNLLIYGLGGLIAPFPFIWLLDRLLILLHLA